MWRDEGGGIKEEAERMREEGGGSIKWEEGGVMKEKA